MQLIPLTLFFPHFYTGEEEEEEEKKRRKENITMTLRYKNNNLRGRQ